MTGDTPQKKVLDLMGALEASLKLPPRLDAEERARRAGPSPDTLIGLHEPIGDPAGDLTKHGVNIPNMRAWVAEHADPYIDGFDGTLLLEVLDELESTRTHRDDNATVARLRAEDCDAALARCAAELKRRTGAEARIAAALDLLDVFDTYSPAAVPSPALVIADVRRALTGDPT